MLMLISGLLLENPSHLFSESTPTLAVTNWSTREGLPQNSVSSVTQTLDGYIWFGTMEGLVRFDGVNMLLFDRNVVPEMISNRVFSLFPASNGDLWIGTKEGGILRYRNQKFESFNRTDPDEKQTVYGIAEDRRGNIWVGVGPWLFRKNAEDSSFEKQSLDFNTDILSLAYGRDGILRLGCGKGMWYQLTYEDGNPTLISMPPVGVGHVYAIYQDQRQNIWVGGDGTGLHQFSSEGILKKKWDSPEMRQVFSFAEDDEQRIWIATWSHGLFYFNPRKHESPQPFYAYPSPQSWSLLFDQEKSLWVGSLGKGVYQLRKSSFSSISKHEGLKNEFLWTSAESENGDLWLGTNEGGAIRICRTGIRAYDEKDGLPDKTVWAVLPDPDGSVWIGTSMGLCKYENGSIQDTELQIQVGKTSVKALNFDLDGHIMVGTGKGPIIYEKGAFVHLGAAGIVKGQVQALLHSVQDRSFWFASNKGLIRYKDGESRVFGAEDGLSGQTVRCLFEDQSGHLLIGSEGGGVLLFENDRFKAFTEKNGLFNDLVSVILQDEFDYLWFSCNKGVSRVNRKELLSFFQGTRNHIESKSFTELDGLISGECNGSSQPAGWRLADGRLMFPTISGVTLVRPNHLEMSKNLTPPLVYLEGLWVNGEKQPPGASQSLPPGSRNLEFRFSSTQFIHANKIRFFYKIDGLHHQWQNLGTQRRVFFPRIPSGTFTVRLKAINSDGVESIEKTVMQLHIKPYFYETVFFYFLVTVTVIGLLYAFYRWKIRQMRIREKELKSLVEDRTLQLEKVNEQLQSISLKDALTGLSNRRHFKTKLWEEWYRFSRHESPLCLFFIDIDYFKNFNDTYGHGEGDKCLMFVASALQDFARRGNDMVARYGGEEFVLIFPDMDMPKALELAKRAVERIHELKIPHASSKISKYVSISLGVTLAEKTDKNPEFFLKRADEAMYEAKKRGRNQFCFL